MNWKSSLKLNSGWAWGIVGFAISTVLSWLAPFGQIPRRYVERSYEKVERKLASKGLMDSVSIAGFEVERLLDYPLDLIDFKGTVVLENSLATDVSVKDVSLLINGQPAKVRFWQPQPGRLDPNQRAEFIFYTTSVKRSPEKRYVVELTVVDSLDRAAREEAQL